MAAAGGEHDEPVNAERDSRAVRQTVFEGCEQPLIDRDSGQIVAFSFANIGLESSPLLPGINEFVIAVGELDTFCEDLESFGQRRIAISDLGQRGLRSRVVMDEGRLAVTELRFDDVGQHQIEEIIAREVVGGRNPEAPGPVTQRGIGFAVRVETSVTGVGFGV